MTDEYNKIARKLLKAVNDFDRLVIIKDDFPEYVARLKATYSDLLLNLHVICQASSDRTLKKQWTYYKNIYDAFSEEAEKAWQIYQRRDLNRAIQPKYRFENMDIKKTFYIPISNCTKYVTELKDALAFIKTGDPTDVSDVESVKKQYLYHHRGYLYLLTAEAENRLRTKITPGLWKDLKRLSTEYEQLSNVFINQGSKLNKPQIKPVLKNPVPSVKTDENMQYYLHCFRNLKRSYRSGKLAPHKLILLLAVLALYRHPEQQKTVLIKMSDELKMLFEQYWNSYVKTDIWIKDISMPWTHMVNEPFWHECSVKSRGCYIDEELRDLLKDKDNRVALRNILKEEL